MPCRKTPFRVETSSFRAFRLFNISCAICNVNTIARKTDRNFFKSD
nr:MAG TPA: hypothetical protein [Caudoviricetes sp.]